MDRGITKRLDRSYSAWSKENTIARALADGTCKAHSLSFLKVFGYFSMKYSTFSSSKSKSPKNSEPLVFLGSSLVSSSVDIGGRNAFKRKRNAITAKENACGRFAVLTTSTLPWKDLLIEYRMRNEVEYDFSQLQSDLFMGVKGRSVQKSAEGGLLVNFISLRLRLMLLNRMKGSDLTDEMWIPKLMKIMRKLRITKVGDEWRLNEVTRKQREILSKLGIPLL